LAGTNSLLHETAPYIESKVVSDVNHLEFRNPSLNKGPINIYSSSGRVAINGILFPTVAETSIKQATDVILKYSGSYPNGYLKWGPISFDETNVGAAGLPTNIYGSPVKLNGYSLEFVDSSVVPNSIGGVTSGFSFPSNSYDGQNWPLSEVIRKVLYPYVAPTLSLSLTDKNTGSTYAQAGQSITANLQYILTIYPRTPSEYVSNYYILTQQKYGTTIGATQGTTWHGSSFSGTPGTTFSASIEFPISDPSSTAGGFYDFTMAYSNVPGTSILGYPLSSSYNAGWSYSTTAQIKFVKPIYHGFSGTSSMVTFKSYAFYIGSATLTTFENTQLVPLLNTLDKIIKPYPGVGNSLKIEANGNGCLYFVYPRNNGIGDILNESSLLRIKDPNGYVLYERGSPTASSFYPGTFDMQAQQGATEYVLWVSKQACSYQGDGSFELTFGTTSSFNWPAAGPSYTSPAWIVPGEADSWFD
jgi:hypothetical protein